MELAIKKEYEYLMPKLSKGEYEELKRSIDDKGLIYPIIINNKRVILDGYHRYKICKELNIEPKVIIKEFVDSLKEKEFVIEVNLKRRHLDVLQRCKLAEEIEAIEREKARIRQLSNLKQFKDITSDTVPCDSPLTVGESVVIAANKVGVSDQTYKRYKYLKNNYPELLKKVEKKGCSLNHAYSESKRMDNIKSNLRPKLHTDNYKRYNVILADPPWDYNIRLRANPSIHYRTLSDEQIYNFLDNNLDNKIDKNAILFLWATNPKLKEALRTIEEWGFEYKTNMVWVKDKIGLGYYVRSKHELLLIAVRGNIVPLEANRPESVIYHEREEHSKKPDIVYDIIEHMYPNANYLELFARNKRSNWDSYGLELKQNN